MNKKWETKTKLKAKSPCQQADRQKLKIKQIIQALLKNRGLKTKKEIEQFLTPPDPYLIKLQDVGINKNQLKKAIFRIKKAIDKKENIVIYGDYDADGISATAILWETLHCLGAKAMPFIPNREKHGYGLNKRGIDEILFRYQLSTISHQSFLIITVDNGITAHQAVSYANKKGIDVIVTDHHQKKIKDKNYTSEVSKEMSKTYDLPQAKAIVWSDKVSGAGVAWFLAREIYQHFHHNLQGFKASNALELATIGTITDMMPVLGVNRSIIKYGLQELRQSQRPGIVALCFQAGISQKELGVYEIGFIIGPRLNAMGRLENAIESLRLLCTNNKKRAEKLAAILGLTNRQRQQLTQTTFEHAKKRSKTKIKKSKIILISSESYNPGIIGLVAGKLVEEFYQPAIVISQGKEFSKGSVRSVSGFNIIKALRKIDVFKDLGGHPMAAGFTIKTSKIKILKEKINKLAKKELDTKLLQPKIKIDLELEQSNISWELLEQIEKLAPFGIGNPRPVFSLKKIKIISLKTVGREQKHLKFQIKITPPRCHLGGVILKAIAFNQGALIKKIKPEKPVDICFSLNKNIWNGNKSLQLIVKDIAFLKKNK